MKVVHINTNRGGGAALCAFRISQTLQSCGVETEMIVAGGTPSEKYHVVHHDKERWEKNRWQRRLKLLLLKMNLFGGMEQMQYNLRKTEQQTNSHIYAHLPLTSYRGLSQHPLIKEADIIHLHWVSGFVDYPTFFKEVKKPIVWTMHDKYPAMGLQHYSSEFFPIPQSLEKIDAHCRKIKRQALLQHDNLHLVAISEYMLQLCEKSEVIQGFPATLIHNGVDTKIFKPSHQESARKDFGLPLFDEKGNHVTAFMVCGCSITDRNKGLDRVVAAIESLETEAKMLVCVGPKPKLGQEPKASFPIYYLGVIQECEDLALVYSATDYFVLASYEETFAQTPLEAMACGRPVISTPCSGASDLIRSTNGVLCEGFSVDAICQGIRQAIATRFSEEEIRNHILQNYSYEIIGDQYLQLYNKVLNSAQ